MRILPIFIPHSGCRFNCVYCNQVSTSQCAEIPDSESIIRLVEEAIQSGRLDEVAYYGGSFTALSLQRQEQYLNLLQPYLSKGLVGGIRLSTRPDALNDQIVQLLRVSGVSTVELGCQSFSDPVLMAAGRGHVAADAVNASALLRDNGFTFGIQLMPGLPGAGPEEALLSLEAALSLGPAFLRIYPTVVLESTRLAVLWKQGAYQPLTLDEAVELCADIEMVCRERNVPVIRYGLQANESLSGGAVLTGPYHPAFGQLVRSRLWRRALKYLSSQGTFSVMVHPDDLSDAVGHKKDNLLSLKVGSKCFSVETTPHLNRGDISVDGTVCQVSSLVTDIGS